MCIALCIAEFVPVYSLADVHVESRPAEHGPGSTEFGSDAEAAGSGLPGGAERHRDGQEDLEPQQRPRPRGVRTVEG